MTHRDRPFHFTRRLWLVTGLFIAYILLFALYVWSEKKIDQANELRYQSFLLADELRQSSDDLTRMARTYVVTGNPLYKTYYQHILDIRNGASPRPVQFCWVEKNGSNILVRSSAAMPMPVSLTEKKTWGPTREPTWART